MRLRQVEQGARLGEVTQEPRAGSRDRRRHEHEQLVDEARLEERGRERRPALEQERLDSLGGELCELVRSPPRAELQPGALRKRPAAEREPARLPRDGDVSCVEAWSIGEHGPHADRDRVGGGPELVHDPSRASPVTQRAPGTVTRPSTVIATL